MSFIKINWDKLLELIAKLPPRFWIILVAGVALALVLLGVAVCIHGDEIFIALRYLIYGPESAK